MKKMKSKDDRKTRQEQARKKGVKTAEAEHAKNPRKKRVWHY